MGRKEGVWGAPLGWNLPSCWASAVPKLMGVARDDEMMLEVIRLGRALAFLTQLGFGPCLRN